MTPLRKLKPSPQSRLTLANFDVQEFNEHNPIGTLVRYWTGAREGEGKLAKTDSAAHVLGGHTAVVWLAGVSGCIALTHVEPVEVTA